MYARVAFLVFFGVAVPALAQHGVHPYWSTPVDLPDAGGDEGGAVGNNITIDSKGTVYVLANIQYDDGSIEIGLTKSSDGGVTWSDFAPFTPAQVGMLGTVSVGPDDRLHVAYIDRVPEYGVYHVYSDDEGQTWSEPVRISPALRSDQISSPFICVDRKNRVHVAWHDGAVGENVVPAEVVYVRSVDGGESWEEAQMLSADDGRFSAYPRFNFRSTTSDTLVIPWRDERTPGDWDVYMAVSTNGGATWTKKLAVGGPGAQWDPESLVGPDGTVHMGVMEFPPGAGEIRVYYMRTTDLGASWSDEVTLSETRARFPHLHYDLAGGVLWYLFKDERDYVSSEDVRADLVGKYSLDGGLTWSALEFATDEGSTEVGMHGIDIGPDGTVHVNYELHADEGKYLRYIQRSPVQETLNVTAPEAVQAGVGEGYPNPAATYIEWPLEPAALKAATSTGHVTVYDVLGRVVDRLVLRQGDVHVRLNTTDYAPGLYLCRFEMGDAPIVRTFVVRHGR